MWTCFSSVAETFRMHQVNYYWIKRNQNQTLPFIVLQHCWWFTWLVFLLVRLVAKTPPQFAVWIAERTTGPDPSSQTHQSGSRCQTGWQQHWRQPCGKSWLYCPGVGSPPLWSPTPSSWPWSLEQPGGVKMTGYYEANLNACVYTINRKYIIFATPGCAMFISQRTA